MSSVQTPTFEHCSIENQFTLSAFAHCEPIVRNQSETLFSKDYEGKNLEKLQSLTQMIKVILSTLGQIRKATKEYDPDLSGLYDQYSNLEECTGVRVSMTYDRRQIALTKRAEALGFLSISGLL